MTERRGTNPAGKHRVVIVGAGFGGLFAAKTLRSPDVSVTLINGPPASARPPSPPG